MGANADLEVRVILEGFCHWMAATDAQAMGVTSTSKGGHTGPIYSVPHGRSTGSDGFDNINGGPEEATYRSRRENSLDANNPALRVEPRWRYRLEYLAKGSHDASLGF